MFLCFIQLHKVYLQDIFGVAELLTLILGCIFVYTVLHQIRSKVLGPHFSVPPKNNWVLKGLLPMTGQATVAHDRSDVVTSLQHNTT